MPTATINVPSEPATPDVAGFLQEVYEVLELSEWITGCVITRKDNRGPERMPDVGLGEKPPILRTAPVETCMCLMGGMRYVEHRRRPHCVNEERCNCVTTSDRLYSDEYGAAVHRLYQAIVGIVDKQRPDRTSGRVSRVDNPAKHLPTFEFMVHRIEEYNDECVVDGRLGRPSSSNLVVSTEGKAQILRAVTLAIHLEKNK